MDRPRSLEEMIEKNYLTMAQSINQALDQEMEQNADILIMGEDVGKNGGVFRVTENLYEKYGEEKVNDTPLAESGIGGMAIGLAYQGFRPVMEIQFLGFMFEAMDSLVGQMARISYRTGGGQAMPIVVRAPFGGGVRSPELHSDNFEGILAQVPGLKVVIPATAIDAKGLLTSAMRDDDPVIFLEHMYLYRSFREQVPKEQYEVEIGKARVAREGSDVTIISYGWMVSKALEASELLEEEGISAEVIDLRTVSPVDYETIIESIKKTKHVVVAQEAQRQTGVGNQIISELSQRAILHLLAPIQFVSAPNTNYPFAMLEDKWLPNETDIYNAVQEAFNYSYA